MIEQTICGVRADGIDSGRRCDRPNCVRCNGMQQAVVSGDAVGTRRDLEHRLRKAGWSMQSTGPMGESWQKDGDVVLVPHQITSANWEWQRIVDRAVSPSLAERQIPRERPTGDIISDLRLTPVDDQLRRHGLVAARQFMADAAERLEELEAELARLRTAGES